MKKYNGIEYPNYFKLEQIKVLDHWFGNSICIQRVSVTYRSYGVRLMSFSFNSDGWYEWHVHDIDSKLGIYISEVQLEDYHHSFKDEFKSIWSHLNNE